MSGITPNIVQSGGADGTVIMSTFGSPGTYTFAGIRFTLGMHGVFASGAESARMFSSTDGGATFPLALDTAHEPTNTVRGLGAGTFWAPGERFVYLVWGDDTGHLSFNSFDLQSKVWGTPVTGGPACTSGQLQRFSLNRRSDGSWAIAFPGSNGGFAVWFIATLTGAAWSAAQQISDIAGQNANPSGTVLDASDRLHTIFEMGNDGSIRYRNWKAGVFGGASVALSIPHNFPTAGLHGLYVSATDEVVFPLIDGFGDAYVLRGSPSAAPVFTTDMIVTGNTNILNQNEVPVMAQRGTTLYFAWINLIGAGGTADLGLMYATQTVGGGVWSAPQFWWNWAANPPNPDPGLDNPESFLYFDPQPDGSIDAGVGLAVGTPLDGFCGGLYYLAGPAVFQPGCRRLGLGYGANP